MAEAAHDSLIRELYLNAAAGPLRVSLGDEGFPPFIDGGDVVLIDRSGVESARPGDFVGVRNEATDMRVLRLLERGATSSRVFGRDVVETVGTSEIIGRATHVERDGHRLALDTSASPQRLLLDQIGTHFRHGQRRLRLRRDLASLYWELVDSFESGVSETGDLLTTDRCPVGCRFCIYSCVADGNDMTIDTVRQAATAFRAAGIPRIRILGGEPFMSVPHLVSCYQAIKESYTDDEISILTSAYFGTSAERVRGKIDPLVDEGLRHLHLSFDAFHIERYPVDCYERTLDYCAEKGLVAVLVVHYSQPLMADLDKLLGLREQYPFGVRITTVSREGDASLLSEAETSVEGYAEFRERLVGQPGIELIAEDRSCFRWTVFPSGDVHFCCKQNEENRVGNLAKTDFPTLQARLQSLAHRNRMNVLRFATCLSDDISNNACLSCPLEVTQ